jgi:protein-S-isoprenylcysteine O-methyltransferase Ste14
MKCFVPWSSGSMPDPAGDLTDAVVGGLARARVPLGFVFGVLALWLAQPTASTLAAGAVIAAAGESLRFWAAGHLRKSREVTSSGPYRWLAHPLYVGSSIMGAGLAVASNSVRVAALVAIYLGATLTAAIISEERFLKRTFGDRYERYRQATRSREPDAGRSFSFAQAIANREHRAAVGVAVVLLLLLWKATYNGVFGGS